MRQGPVLAGAQTAPPATIETLDILLQTFPKVGLELEIESLGSSSGPRYIITNKLLGVGATARVYLGTLRYRILLAEKSCE